MDMIEKLEAAGLFDKRVPRYTSYPTAPVFKTDVAGGFAASCLERLEPDTPISVYVHIPFCERLCWFCACRTQGIRSEAPVDRYVETLISELESLRKLLPNDISMGRLHWGGGTPTILKPDLIEKLAQALKQAIQPSDTFEFSVEIDPTLVDQDKVDALQRAGMNRASIGIQDFATNVQKAIGRPQGFELTQACVQMLRNSGIRSLNTDILYGLPHQTMDSVLASTEQVLSLDPDRVALFGYAHVPWMAKRQRMIDEDTLPDEHSRYRLSSAMAERFVGSDYQAIGIDHFAKPSDSLAIAGATGSLRRNFQGYTDDTCPTLLGVGASAISAFPHGYVQNASATAAYSDRIRKGLLAAYRGHSFSLADRVRGRAIESIMCDFRLDIAELVDLYGDAARKLQPICKTAADQFSDFVNVTGDGIEITPEGRPLTRIIAQLFDEYSSIDAAYSRAS